MIHLARRELLVMLLVDLVPPALTHSHFVNVKQPQVVRSANKMIHIVKYTLVRISSGMRRVTRSVRDIAVPLTSVTVCTSEVAFARRRPRPRGLAVGVLYLVTERIRLRER